MEALKQFDLNAFRAIHVGLHQDWLDPVFWLLTSTGLGWVQAIGILFLPLLMKPLDTSRSPFDAVRDRLRDPHYLVLPLLVVEFLSGVIFADVIKQFLNRDRPSSLWFAHPQENIHSYSFPSGHTSTAFGIAFLLLFATWRTPKSWAGWLAISWAAMVGISRIYRGVHWPTDVLGGMFDGLAAASFVWLIGVRPREVRASPSPSAGPESPSAIPDPS